MIEHIESCMAQHYRECWSNEGNHRWSGWPGAFCLDCGDDDVIELCIGNVCECPCHDEFWQQYEEDTQKVREDQLWKEFDSLTAKGLARLIRDNHVPSPWRDTGTRLRVFGVWLEQAATLQEDRDE